MSLKDFEYKPFAPKGQEAIGDIESNANLPIQINDESKNILIPNQQPIVNTEPELDKPGFFESVGHFAYQTSEITAAYDFLQTPYYQENPLNDKGVDEGFDPTDINHYLDIDQNHWGYLFGATSQRDMQMRREWVKKQTENDEKFADGSLTSKLLGGAIGLAASPSTYLFGIPGMLKYAKFSEGIAKNTLKAAPMLTAQTVAHEGFMEATDTGGNLEDFARNVLIDELFGLGLVAGGSALAPSITGGKLWNMKRVMGDMADGIVYRDIIEDGEHVGWKAESAPGFALNAARVKEAQDFADYTFKQSGLFAVPGVGRGLNKVVQWSNPIVKGMSSSYESVRYITGKFASNGFITKGIDEGKASLPTVQDLMGELRAKQTIFDMDYRRLYLQANGIKPGLQYQESVNLFKAKSQEGFMSPDDFGAKVRYAAVTGEQSEIREVNSAALMVRKTVDDIFNPFVEAYGLDKSFFNVKTASNYLMRNWHVDNLVNFEGDFVEHIAGVLKEQDDTIAQLMEPIENLESGIKYETESKLGAKGETEQQAIRVRMLKSRLKTAKQELENKVRDNDDYRVLLDDYNFLTTAESEELERLLQPITIAEKEISTFKTQIQRLKEQRSRAKSNAIKTQDKDLQLKHQQKIDELQTKIDELKDRVDAISVERLDELAKLRDLALENKINRKFWYRNQETNFIDFRNPSETIKLRKPYESHEMRRGAAMAWHSTLTGNNPEQIANQVMNTMYPNLFANPLNKRSIMIPDKHLIKWLDNDIAKNVATYRNSLGRKTILKKTFGEGLNYENETESLFNKLSEEYQQKKDALASKLKGDELKKALAKEKRAFDREKEFLTKLFKSQLQAKESDSVQDIIKTLKNYSAIKHLGSVPLVMLSDLYGIVLKNGVWDFFTGGLIPSITSLNGLIKSKSGIHLRENSADLGVALNHVQEGYMQKFTNNESMNYVPTEGWSGRAYNFSQKAGQMSGNLYGTNYIENFVERVAAGTAQSRMIRLLKKYEKNGKLSKTEDLSLRLYGINPEEDAKTFLSQFKEHGFEQEGGYYSNWWNWKDDAASNKMKIAVRRAVADSSIKANPLDRPFWLHNEAFSFMTQFMGWGFSAFSRYTIPMMQRMDANKIMGIMLMFAAGTLTDPLRRWSRGEEFNYEGDNGMQWFFSSLNNSGILGMSLDGVEAALSPTGLIDNIKNDKYHYRDQLSSIGPAGSILSDGMNVISMFAQQDWNTRDIQKAIRLSIPLSNAWYLRYATNKFAESFNVPERPQR